MPTFGLIVEGIYDEAALTELTRKCIAGNIEVLARPCRGSIMDKFPELLESFCYIKQGTHVDKAIVIRDANGKDPSGLIQQMQSKISNRNYPFPVKLVVVFRELETWLLADHEAMSKVAGDYSGRTVPRVNESLEEILTPKERLEHLLAQAKVLYTPEVARKIAAATDIERLRYRCPGFGKFQEAVSDC